MASLQGKAGVVTGAARGIGAACAMQIARDGASVVVADIDGSAAEAVAGEIRAIGGNAVAVVCDVRREADAGRIIEACTRQFGYLDFIVQNAAVQVEKPLHLTSNDEWDTLHEVNLRALFWGAKHALNTWLYAGRGGVILNMASVLSITADPLLAAYTTMKHGVLGLTRAIATNREYAALGVRCNCICPGDVLTDMQRQYWSALPNGKAAEARVAAHYPADRIGLPAEIATCAAFLVSPDSQFINGTAIVADGGLTSLVY